MVAKYKVRICGFVVLVAFFNQTASAQRDLTDIPEPNPTAELAAMTLDSAVKVNLFAADPDIRKPIQMNFDAKGRLWVASSESYPQLAPGEKANDKILVLEDTDHDGTADKSTVFADGLLIPTGVLPDGTDACYVAHATEILYLQDTDGDGRADRREVVLSGFGTEDTHHLIHTLRWGPDGCLYFNQSIYIHSTVETAYGTEQLDGGGIWRYRPETGRLEIVCRGFVNPWGHAFDAFGQSLATDGAYFEGVNHVFPDAVFVTSPGAPRWLSGMNPGSPKHCGLAVISGDHFPESWQGDVVTNDFRSHRVCRFSLKPKGSSYESRQQPELINSSHIAFRPIDAGIGGDGALYVADWYNPIIQHGEVDFRDERRDRSRGRIWRISVAGQPLSTPLNYSNLDISALVDLLDDKSLTVRQFARLELKRRPVDHVRAATLNWVNQADEEIVRELREMEAMWIDQCLDVVDADRLARLMAAQEGRVRAAAVRTISDRRRELEQSAKWLADAVVDSHPQVRLEAIAALGRGNSADNVEQALRAIDHPVDASIDFALWNTVRRLSSAWTPKLAAGEFDFGNDPNRLVFLLSAAGTPAAAEPVLQAIVGQSETIKLTVPQISTLAVPLAGIVDAQQLTRLADFMLGSDGWNEEAKLGLFRGILEQAKKRGLQPADIQPVVIEAYANADSSPLRTVLAESAGAWKLAGMVPVIRESFQAKSSTFTDASERAAVIRTMGLIGTAEANDWLAELTRDANVSAEDRAEAAVALVGPAQARGLEAIKQLFEVATTRSATIERLGGILARKGLQEKMIGLFGEVGMTADDARKLLSVARSAGAPENLLDSIRSAGTLEDAGWKWSDEFRDSLLQLMAEQGDAHRGEAIYRRESLQCIKCHAIGTAGGLVGPNLVSLGGGSTAEYVLRSLIEPNEKLKEGYNTVQVLTLDGRVVQGIPAGGDQETLQLRTAEGTVVSIARNDIEAESNGQSLMPAGLVDSLTRTELADLNAFLTSLGRVPEFSVSTKQVVRTVDSLTFTADANRILNRTSTDAVANDDPAFIWKPLTSRVDGILPIVEMDRYQQHQGIPPASYVRFVVNLDEGGQIDWQLSQEEGVSLWLDGKPTPLGEAPILRLQAGEHTVILGLDHQQISDGLRIELN